MREIPLTRGYVAIVDDEDYATLARHKWYAHPDNFGNVYAKRMTPRNGGSRQQIRMHRAVAGAGVGQRVDHINGNTLDNRRANLRPATNAENCRNRKMNRNNTSGYKGVSWDNSSNKWRAQIRYEYRIVLIGFYADPIEAARAYDRKAVELFGDFARLNFPQEATC